MSLLSTIRSYFTKANQSGIPFPNAWTGGETAYGQWNWHNPYANTAINYKRAVGDLTGSSLLMAAVNWAGTAFPEAPLQVLEKKSAKIKEPIENHPMIDLLEHPTRYQSKNGPREYFAGELLWRSFAASYILDGNVYFRKVRNNFGEVIQLWPENSSTIRPRWPKDGSEWISYYEVIRNGVWYRVGGPNGTADDVIHFRYALPTGTTVDPLNDRLALSPAASLYREVFTDGERARYNALIFKNGGVIPFLLTPDPANMAGLKPKEIKEEFEYRMGGDNIGRPMVLTGAAKLTPMGATPDQLLIEKASWIPATRVAAALGIPAGVLGLEPGLEQTKVGATMKQLREQAAESFLIPHYRVMAGELQSQLLPEFGDTKNLIVAHDLSQVRVLQDDRVALFEREIKAYDSGVKTRAEVKSALGIDTTPNDEVYKIRSSETLISPDERSAPVAAPVLPVGNPAQPQPDIQGKSVDLGDDELAGEWWKRYAPDNAPILPKRVNGRA